MSEVKEKATKAPKAAKAPKAKKATEVAETEESRGRRKVRQGLVVSNKMSKTVVVKIERRVQHALYGKVVLRTKRYKAHDEQSCDVGDLVEIMECRPLSKEKRFRVTRIIEKVK